MLFECLFRFFNYQKLKSFKNKAYLLHWIQLNHGLEHPDLLSGGS